MFDNFSAVFIGKDKKLETGKQYNLDLLWNDCAVVKDGEIPVKTIELDQREFYSNWRIVYENWNWCLWFSGNV